MRRSIDGRMSITGRSLSVSTIWWRRVGGWSPLTLLLRIGLGQRLEELSGHQRRHLWQLQVKKGLPY